ncbi:MAG: flagellar export protein FliJ [Alcaligenaceae bacterium]|nr:flagellar export protein FliJ [Alcaligenaceae bacterium]
MSSNNKTFEMLHELAQRKLDDAGKAVGATEASITQARKQLEMLSGYKADYLQKLQARLQEGMNSTQYINFQNFITTLDEALIQQHGMITQLEKQAEQERAQWLEMRRETKSINSLIERNYRQQLIHSNRQEQKMNDEFAARAYRAQQLARNRSR